MKSRARRRCTSSAISSGVTAPTLRAAGSVGEWTADAVAGDFDDLYGATCDDQNEQARFETDAPRLHLGPLPESLQDVGRSSTEVEGTDCPGGTEATVAITFGDTRTMHTATIDEYGDWNVALPGPAGRGAARRRSLR